MGKEITIKTDLLLESQNLLFHLVSAENMRQVKKFGVQTASPEKWMCWLTEEVGELAEAINDKSFKEGSDLAIRDEAIQVATLALKIAEMHK